MSRMTPEGRVKARVRKRLAECGVPYYLFMPVQRGMGEPSLDFIGCISGQFFAIETKAGNGDMTPRQRQTELRMCAAGAIVFLLNEEPVGWQDFEDWLVSTVAIEALNQKEPEPPRFPLLSATLTLNRRKDGNRS